MSLISLSFYVTPFEITPCHPQYAGVQGSHEAVEAVFELDERLYADSYLYRLEYMDGAGAGDTSDLLKPVFQESTGRYLIQSLLPDGWTQSGGGGTIRVVIARLNEIGHEEMVFYSLPARVYFSSREEDGAMKPLRHGLSALIADAHKAGERAEKAADSVEEALSNAADAINAANAARDAANTAAGNASAAAGNANQAAEAAASAAAMAVSASDGANLAASAASQSATAANTAAGNANTAATAAGNAAAQASDATIAANAAASAANSAAAAANQSVENMAEKAIPYIEPVLDYAGDNSYEVTGTPVTGTKGEAFRVGFSSTWKASGTTPQYSLYYAGVYYPIQPAGEYPAGVYILIYDGTAWQIQADMSSTVQKADKDDALTVIPTVTLLCDTAGDLSYDLMRDGAVFWLNGAPGEAIRVVSDTEWQASGEAPKYGINIRGGTKPIQPAGTYPAGAYILVYDGSAFQIQADIRCVEERVEQAEQDANEAVGTHAAEARRTYQPAFKRTVSGTPVMVTDAAAGADLSGLILKGRTVVSGTPSPTAPVTVTGVMSQTVEVTGKNLIPVKAKSETINGVTCTVNADGSVTFNGTATATCYFNFPTMLLTPGTYTLSGGAALPTGARLVTRNADVPSQLLAETSSTVSSKAFTIGDVIKTLVFVAVPSGTSFSNITVYPQLETGATATTHEPYQGRTITPESLTLYGHDTAADTLDLATGAKLRQWERLELTGEENWTHTASDGWHQFSAPLSIVANSDTEISDSDLYCTHWVPRTTEGTNRIYLANYGQQITVACSISGFETQNQWTSWLQAQSAAGTPVTILYRRLEPEVTQGEAQFLAQPEGTLNVSATGTRSGVLEGVEAEVTYTYQPDMDDILNRLAEAETQIAALIANQ